MLLSVLIRFYGKKISVPEFLRSARSSFLLFPIKKENRQRLYNLLSIFILKLILPYHPCFRHAKRTHIRKICIPVCVPLYGFIICSILRLELCLNTLKCCCDYLVHIIILVLSKSSAEYYILACLCKLLVLLVKRIVLVVVYRVVWLYARLPLC